MAGSAEQVDRWLLIEYRPTWRAKATTDNELNARAREWLADEVEKSVARGERPRLQFIRQPEKDEPGVTLFVATPEATRRVRVDSYDALLDVDLDRHGEPVAEPQFFVCTNGQRDLCCARFGLPTYAALRTLVGDAVWQTTHVGGHRFAPNVVVLPQGDVYGRVHAEVVPQFLAELGSGNAFDWLRGSSFEVPAVQAARGFVRSAAAVRSVVAMNADRFRVTFDDDANADVVLGAEELAVASCDDVPKPVRSWRLAEQRL